MSFMYIRAHAPSCLAELGPSQWHCPLAAVCVWNLDAQEATIIISSTWRPPKSSAGGGIFSHHAVRVDVQAKPEASAFLDRDLGLHRPSRKVSDVRDDDVTTSVKNNPNMRLFCTCWYPAPYPEDTGDTRIR